MRAAGGSDGTEKLPNCYVISIEFALLDAVLAANDFLACPSLPAPERGHATWPASGVLARVTRAGRPIRKLAGARGRAAARQF